MKAPVRMGHFCRITVRASSGKLGHYYGHLNDVGEGWVDFYGQILIKNEDGSIYRDGPCRTIMFSVVDVCEFNLSQEITLGEPLTSRFQL